MFSFLFPPSLFMFCTILYTNAQISNYATCMHVCPCNMWGPGEDPFCTDTVITLCCNFPPPIFFCAFAPNCFYPNPLMASNPTTRLANSDVHLQTEARWGVTLTQSPEHLKSALCNAVWRPRFIMFSRHTVRELKLLLRK